MKVAKQQAVKQHREQANTDETRHITVKHSKDLFIAVYGMFTS